jgi:hypothetical protein
MRVISLFSPKRRWVLFATTIFGFTMIVAIQSLPPFSALRKEEMFIGENKKKHVTVHTNIISQIIL